MKISPENRPTSPAAYPTRILLAVTGLSPQVVTETLYALAIKGDEAFIPTEIHLLTTVEGAERARLSLLHLETGRFNHLRHDYGLPDIHFDEDNIHVVRGAGDVFLSDIRTPQENEQTADQIVELVRKLTGDADSAVHASIAGGRKTMGFYLGYALSLYGRAQDRLSHVLVSAPFESHPDFYYPTKDSRVIYTPGPDRRPLDTSQAEVTLAEIPFVRLRHGLPEKLLEGRSSFSATVAAAQRVLGPTHVNIDLEGKVIDAGGTSIVLPPAELAFLSWFARRKVKGFDPFGCPSDGVPEQEYAEEYLREYEQVADPLASGTARRLQHGMDKAFFEEKKAKLHRWLREALGPEGVLRYGIQGHGRPRMYKLSVDRGVVEWRMSGEGLHE